MHRDHVRCGGDPVDRARQTIDMRGYLRRHDFGRQMRRAPDRQRDARLLRGLRQTFVAMCQFQRLCLAEERQLAAAPRDQPPTRDQPAEPVVDPDRTMLLPFDLAAPYDEWAIVRGDPFDRVELIRLTDQQDAIEHARTDDPLQPIVRIGDDAGEHDIVSALGQLVRQMPQDRHEERIGKMLALFMSKRDDDTDDIGLLGPQPAGHLVRAKPMVDSQRLYPGARFGVD